MQPHARSSLAQSRAVRALHRMPGLLLNLGHARSSFAQSPVVRVLHRMPGLLLPASHAVSCGDHTPLTVIVQLMLFIIIIFLLRRMTLKGLEVTSYVLFGSLHSNAKVNGSSSNLSPAGNENNFVSFSFPLPQMLPNSTLILIKMRTL